MSRELAYRCPCCQHKLASASGMQTATQIIRRKCPGCRTLWQIKIVSHAKNIHGNGVWFDVGTFVELEGHVCIICGKTNCSSRECSKKSITYPKFKRSAVS